MSRVCHSKGPPYFFVISEKKSCCLAFILCCPCSACIITHSGCLGLRSFNFYFSRTAILGGVPESQRDTTHLGTNEYPARGVLGPLRVAYLWKIKV